jgi:hypothetical protein
VVNGQKSLQSTHAINGNGQAVFFNGDRHYVGWHSYMNLPDGIPSGQIGLYSNAAGATFSYDRIFPSQQINDIAGRWLSHTPNLIGSVAIQAATDRLQTRGMGLNSVSFLLRGLWLDNFQVSFCLYKEGGSSNNASFVFDADDQNNYCTLMLSDGIQSAPYAMNQVNGAMFTSVSATRNNSAVPIPSAGSPLWYQVTCNGNSVTVKSALTESGLDTASVCYSSTGFSRKGGMIGFDAGFNYNAPTSIDELTVKRWNASTSAFDIVEHVDHFTVDTNGYANETLTYDAAGNLTYDGVEAYTYDAWNRLISVTHAYRDDGGILHTGKVFETMSYDGQGRRIVKAINGTGQFDCTYHYYYDQSKVIETRNGSNQTLKQQVWGIQYVDELLQIAVNTDPTADNTCEALYWAMQDANWNVLGIVDSTGMLVERYEYTPYGRRTVFFSPGSSMAASPSPMVCVSSVIRG